MDCVNCKLDGKNTKATVQVAGTTLCNDCLTLANEGSGPTISTTIPALRHRRGPHGPDRSRIGR